MFQNAIHTMDLKGKNPRIKMVWCIAGVHLLI